LGGCGDGELTALTEAQMCDEVRGLLSFQALGCTSDEAAAGRFGDQLYSRFTCAADLRPTLAACLRKVRELRCDLIISLMEDATYLHWADACLTVSDLATPAATCATAAAAFADSAFVQLAARLPLPLDSEERAARAADITAFLDVVASYRGFWWPCADATASVSALEACVSDQRVFTPATATLNTTAAAAALASFARSPQAPNCAALFPPAPIRRAWSDTALVFDLIAATLPLLDLDAPASTRGADLRAWFVSAYAPRALSEGEGASADEDALACFNALSDLLNRADATASAEAFAQAFTRTRCHAASLQAR
jgi:hypothetical protein